MLLWLRKCAGGTTATAAAAAAARSCYPRASASQHGPQHVGGPATVAAGKLVATTKAVAATQPAATTLGHMPSSAGKSTWEGSNGGHRETTL